MALHPEETQFRLLAEFRRLFDGKIYKHRASNQGDFVAMHLFEDLVTLGRSGSLVSRVQGKVSVLNAQNRLQGIRARRGDGTLGEILPGETAMTDQGYEVGRGRIATVEIGVEVKILAKAMIKQIDRVLNDLRSQVTHFRRGGESAITVGIVGVNHAPSYVSYEGERSFRTTGRGGYLHPFQEADEAEGRLQQLGAPAFDEFLLLRFIATNAPPYHFEWVDYEDSRRNYGAILARVSREYQKRI
ncbi:MAG TPA: hypothetical protein VLW83_14445 [Candidatus Acidoferrales bacterium]|nr:hypothetical protein [Candidatus Acidoferrales bacterium]